MSDTLIEIAAHEERLRMAMLSRNIAALNELISDKLLFVGPDARVYRKSDDLEAYRNGVISFSCVSHKEMLIEGYGDSAVSTVLTWIEGKNQDRLSSGLFRYIRFWRLHEHGWQIIGGSVCALGPSNQ